MNMFVKEILFFVIFSPLIVDAIIGGEYVTNPHQYPWMVFIESFDSENNQHTNIGECGGAIISENMILTAAHCVESGWSEFSRGSEYSKKSGIFVAIGHSTLDKGISRLKVESKLIHPNYLRYNITQYEEGVFDLYEDTKLVANADIALLKLSEDLKFNKEIQPIALPDEDFNETNYLDKSRSKFMVAGWGVTFDIPNDFYQLFKSEKWTLHKSKIPKEKYLKLCIPELGGVCEDNIKLMDADTLKVTEVDYIKLSKDSSTYKKKKMPVEIRAMSTQPYIPGFCHGDSGGPLMKLDVTSNEYEVVGIVSRFDEWSKLQGPRGCLGSMPSVYTRVSAFVPWIKESMTNPDSFMQLYQETQIISEDMWDCEDGKQTIPKRYHCNKYPDCSDKSDEGNCSTPTSKFSE
jgi:hypothetical protein